MSLRNIDENEIGSGVAGKYKKKICSANRHDFVKQKSLLKAGCKL